MIRLSIVSTLFNSATYLPKCLDSLLCQDIPKSDYEIILVVDGSPDNSEAIAQSYAAKNENIRVIIQENKGLAGARNTGVRAAQGKYLYFVDPDDYILENSLHRLLEIMEEEDLDVLRFGYQEVDEHYQPTRSARHYKRADYSSCLMDGYSFMARRLGIACYVWTYLYRTSLVKGNSLFFIEGEYFDDTPWLPRVLSYAKRVDSIDWDRHFYLIRSNSLVQAVDKKSIHRKINGELFLVSELKRQYDATENINGRRWYKMMIAHCVVALLTLVGLVEFENRSSYILSLKQKRVFPLSLYKSSLRGGVFKIIASISPYLFVRLFHMRTKIK